MKTDRVYYFLVTTPEITMTWLGGRLIPDGPDFVFLTSPSGERLMRTRREYVKPTTRPKTAERMAVAAKTR